MSYWVVGGEYVDTKFEVAAPGQSIERLGPFDTYESAHHVWAARAWGTVDNAMCRYRIIKDDQDVTQPDHPLSEKYAKSGKGLN
ncbi:MAG TPA: DUF4170 domain-containing protein [Stellaceae bacterium]|nr:DUF4170 domain-containing protein [Stellaceae bacterium]